jgi:lipid A ethanolaminephosphotransferase
MHRAARAIEGCANGMSIRRQSLIVLAVSAFIVVILNIPFWRRLLESDPLDNASGWAFFASIAIGLVALTNLALTAVAHRRLFPTVMAVVLPVTAAASYFMYEYGVVIDDNMVRNIFETNTSEARDLTSASMLLAIALFGVLPAAVIWQVRWEPLSEFENFRVNLKAAALSAIVAVAAIYPFWGDYLSTFREHRELRLTLTPLNYISATVKYLRSNAAVVVQDVQPNGLDATHAKRSADSQRKSLFVIVVGETARADHFGLNGYARQTTPELAKLNGLINFPEAYSCGTDTAQSVPCMFSNLGRSGFSNQAAGARENLLDVLKHAGIDVVWRDNQAGCKGVCARVATESLTHTEPHATDSHTENFDEVLLDGLDARIAQLERDTVIVLHMMGSHGPAYYKRYPDSFEKFVPACMQTRFSLCTRDEIINAYDNSIAYSDFVLAKLATILDGASAKNVDGAMLYVSDHGESLGENNIYLHGMPYALAPPAQIHVPMVVWMSEGFRKAAGIDLQCLQRNAAAKTSHDALFHSVLGAMDVKTTTYKPELDLFGACRGERKTM